MAILKRFQHRDVEGFRVGRFDLGINTSFIVYRFGGTVFDTGPTNQWKYVESFIQEKPLKQLILTHHHEDHSGNAGNIQRLTGVTPNAPTATIDILKKGFKIPFPQHIIWGAASKADAQPLTSSMTLDNGEPIEALFAPGHAKDMTCYLLSDRGWLLSADLYIANHLKLLRSDESVPLILQSTHAILQRDFDTILCPHKGVVENGKARLQEKYDFLIELSSKAQALQQQGDELEHITQKLLGEDSWFVALNGYNFSRRNLIASCLEVSL